MRLYEQVRELGDRRNSVNEAIAEFRAYLAGPKFHGHDSRDGLPNSYIATHEVEARLLQISALLND